MRSRSNANWLVLITLCLTIAALFMFYISLRDSLGIKQCAYGEGNISEDCYCDDNGKVVCEDGIGGGSEKVLPSEFTTDNLSYTYDFLNYIENSNSINSDIRFVDISSVDSNLRITIEKQTLCNKDSFPAPQIGFYRSYEDSLILTIGSNLVDENFNIPCFTENIFNIYNLGTPFPQDFKVLYQNEVDALTSANNCVYEGFLRNENDTYQSLDGCALCTCSKGLNRCELENSCLK